MSRFLAVFTFAVALLSPHAALAQSDDAGSTYSTEITPTYTHTTSHPTRKSDTDKLPPLFSTAQEAHDHCPKETVVWLNTRTGIYHERGMRWYGNTKAGAYVCVNEANAAGDRDTRNGQ